LLRFLLGSSSSLICWVADNNISDDYSLSIHQLIQIEYALAYH
jgi:hypothetical protein